MSLIYRSQIMLIKYTVLIFCLCLPIQAIANNVSELKSAEAQILAENLKREINQTLAEIRRLEQLEEAEGFTVSLSQPSFSFINLGAVLDPVSKVVLSVSPHSNAEALGLKVGDKISVLQIDEETITDFSEGIQLKAGNKILAEVIRTGNDQSISLHTTAKSKIIPAWTLEVSSTKVNSASVQMTGCGYVSVFFTPPGTQYQYPAKVFEVDGETGFHLRETIKLPAGQHTLKVHEYIPEHMLPRRKAGIEKAKTLEVMIEPDKTYHIAAQFEPEKRLNLVDEAYWEPVVWKVSESKCRP